MEEYVIAVFYFIFLLHASYFIHFLRYSYKKRVKGVVYSEISDIKLEVLNKKIYK